jgi:hypothetical protein
MLWPTFDAERLRWTRPPSDALMQADFQLLEDLHGELNNPVNGLGDSPTNHWTFFSEEDNENIIFGAHYERYDPGLPQYLREHFTDILWNGCDRKIGSLHYQLKSRFQRPRAYQVAVLSRRLKYRCLWAKTGGTPSFVSGHCLQGSLAGCSAYLLFGRSVDSVSVEVLKQFTVDIGDRRVFAGVHYPSDNLSSWYTALMLLPHVVDDTDLAFVRGFLWDAIGKKSIVFAAIQKHIDANRGNSPYEKAVDAIRAIARC